MFRLTTTTGPALLLGLSLALGGSLTATAVEFTTPTPSPAPSPDASLQSSVREQEFWLESLSIPDAWGTTRGEGQTIAVIDTGIGRGSPVFEGVVGGKDFSGVGTLDGRTPVGVQDRDHGSLVASVAAGRDTLDGTAMIGVAPDADLLSASIGFPGSQSNIPFTRQVADAIFWSVDNGADVINLSFTTNTLDWDESWDEAFLYAYDHDVVIVVAAGNRGSGTNMVGAPATIPGVLVVGGIDRSGFASQEASTQGITIGVSAPSEELVGVTAEGAVVNWYGTSAATPIVTGIVALVRAAHPELTAGQVINRIELTADPVGSGPAGGIGNGPDPLYGYGIANAGLAVTADILAAGDEPGELLREWIKLHRRAKTVPAPDPAPGAVEIPPLPAPDNPTAVSPLLPSEESLLYGTLPLFAFTISGVLVGLVVTAAIKRVRLAREAEQGRNAPDERRHRSTSSV
ncbi:S8 family serine peptidase [Microbacterium esteraromaticum]|nr:S8 family serine peptidase [Microbacterium esteraromaticum]